MPMENNELVKSVVPNTCSWEQKILRAKKPGEKGKQKRVNMERGTNKKSLKGLAIV